MSAIDRVIEIVKSPSVSLRAKEWVIELQDSSIRDAAELAKLRSDFADVSSELTRQENENLRLVNILDKTRKVIIDMRDLTRTGLPYGGYTEEEWAMHRLNRIARDLTAWLVETQEYSNDPE